MPGDGVVVEAVAEVIEPAARPTTSGQYVVVLNASDTIAGDIEVMGPFSRDGAQAWRDVEGAGSVYPLTIRAHRKRGA